MAEDGYQYDETREVKKVIADRLLKIADDVENCRTENLEFHLENIVQFLLELEAMTLTDYQEIYDLIINAMHNLTEKDEVMQRKKPKLKHCNERGRPSFLIPEETLSYYIENGFKINEMADLMSVSRRTIINRMQEFGLSIRDSYTQISDAELDEIVSKKVTEFPDSGYKSVLGHLKAGGFRIQETRVLEAMRRVDPFGVLVRKMFMRNYRIKRRTYSVTAPNALWHVDSNHKLIRWRFVIHGGIDGYSRLPTYLKVASDNKAETALEAFKLGVSEYGLPHRVRTDKGKENIRIAEYMLQRRGLHNKCHITGRSVHNQRIERFWREVWYGCTGAYHRLFTEMEETGYMNVESELDMYALHVVYLERIQNSLQKFSAAVSRRPLRTEGNKTPLQLWIMGQANDPLIELSEEDAVMFGVDIEGYIGMDTEEEGIVVPALIPFPNEVIGVINQIKDCAENSSFETDIYLQVKEYLSSLYKQ